MRSAGRYITAFFLLNLFFSTKAIAQKNFSKIDDLIKIFSSKNDTDNLGYLKASDELNKMDSTSVWARLNELVTHQTSNHYFNARFYCLKAEETAKFYYLKTKTLVKTYFDTALNEAYRTSDDYLIAFVCQTYAGVMYDYQEIEISTTYYLKAAEIGERRNQKVNGPYSFWFRLGIALFHIREYKKSIYYIRKGLENWSDTSASSDAFRVSYWNAIGQDYQQLGQLDSALVIYERSKQIAIQRGDQGWAAINYGYIGQVFFQLKQYEKAKPLLRYEYNTVKQFDYNIAANSLQWLARIYIIEGQKDSALLRLRESFDLLSKSNSFPLQNREFLQYAYYTAADLYKIIGNADSVHYYFQLYAELHDSLERVATLSSLKISQLKVDNEKNYQTIQLLENEKKEEELKRNFFIAGIIWLAMIAILYVNRLRLKHFHKEQLAMQEKKAAEQEITSAKEQMQIFTESIIEKTFLIERLEQQIKRKELSSEQHRMIDEISHLTILTEEEWEKFKSTFEKIYPGFFLKLKEKRPDITSAEQRMAALIRLRLTTKQIATMLGISVDSVHKTRQRLRQRLNIAPEKNLEESVAAF